MKANTTKKLNDLVTSYAKKKSAMDALKKEVDADNKAIKTIMEDEELSEYSVDGYEVTYYKAELVSINEELMIEILKKHGVKGVIKKREYVDYDALESLIYHEKVDRKTLRAMDKARDTKEVPTLKIKEVK